MHDIVIRSGKVVDGTGDAIRHVDIAIDNGLISAVGNDIGQGQIEIDASDYLVTPGFVDVHTHYAGKPRGIPT